MVKLCAVKTCPSSRKSRKKNDASQSLSFFQPTTPAKLDKWRKSLGFDLRKTDYICHLHFREEHVRMYDKVTIQGVIYYSYLHKKVLKEEALPINEHQFQPPPQASITTHTKVKELLLKKQPCNKVLKNDEQVNSQMQEQIQITSSKEDLHNNTEFPGLLVERQTDNYYMDNIKTEGSLDEQIENPFTLGYSEEQMERKEHQQTQSLQLVTPKVDFSNTELQKLLTEQQDLNYSENYIKTKDSSDNQIDNQFTQTDMENQLAIIKQEHHGNTELHRLVVDQQANDYSMNCIKSEDSLQEQIENQYAKTDLEEQRREKENPQTKQIQLALPKQEPNCDIELHGLSVDLQANNYSMNYIESEDSLQEEIESQYAKKNLEDQRGGMEHHQIPQVQLATPKQEPYCNIGFKGLLVDQQDNNYSMSYIKTEDNFQELIKYQNNLEKQGVVMGQEYKQTKELNQSIDRFKKVLNEISMLPPYWLYIEKPKELEFMRIDPTTMKLKNHLRLNEDLSITVIFLTKEEFLTKDVVPLKGLKSYLKYVEKWPICVGTQIEKNEFSKTCKGVIIGDETYKKCSKDSRCKSCRILRRKLQNRKYQKYGPKSCVENLMK